MEQRLRVLIYQDDPDTWVGRGIEHDVQAEGRTIGETVRAVLRTIQAHVEADARHDHSSLSTFRPAPQAYWNAFTAGAPVPLSQLGAVAPRHWEISVAIARHRPTETRNPQPRGAARLTQSA
jgi:hypothetical protein